MKQDTPERRSIFTKPRVGLLLAVVVVLAALAAYIGVTRGLAAQPQPTSVHIVRIRGTERNVQVLPLDRTITQVSPVQHLYQTILNLPASCNCVACASSDTEVYVLTFFLHTRAILTVQAHTGQCWDVNLDRGNPTDTPQFRFRRGTLPFWYELAQVLGIPEPVLVPTPS